MQGKKTQPRPFLHPRELSFLSRGPRLSPPKEEGLSDFCSFPVTLGYLVATTLSPRQRALLLVPALPVESGPRQVSPSGGGLNRWVPLIPCGSEDCFDRMEGGMHYLGDVPTCHPKAMAPGDNAHRKPM